MVLFAFGISQLIFRLIKEGERILIKIKLCREKQKYK